MSAVARVCGAHVSLLRDVVQCVGRRLLWCPCDVFFCGWGAALTQLPALWGSNQRATTPATYFRPPGRPCRKESQTFSLIPFRIPWIATVVGCQSTHALSRRGQPVLASTKAPGARDHKGQPAPRLQRFLDLEPSRTTGPRVYKSSSKTGPQWDNQSHGFPDLPV